LTLPHKQAALAIVDRVDPLARRIGAMNTVVVAVDGSLEGSNTDVFGVRENLRERAPDWKASAGPAIVLGAGGASRAIVAALIEARVEEIRIVNRTLARAERLASDLAYPATRITIHPWSERDAVQRDAGLLVNTTSLGMSGDAELDIDLTLLPQRAIVIDIVDV